MNPEKIINLMVLLRTYSFLILRIQTHRAKEVMASAGKCQELIKNFIGNWQLGNRSNPAGPYKP